MKKIFIPLLLVIPVLASVAFTPMSKAADVKSRAINHAPFTGSECHKWSENLTNFVHCYITQPPGNPTPPGEEPLQVLAKY